MAVRIALDGLTKVFRGREAMPSSIKQLLSRRSLGRRVVSEALTDVDMRVEAGEIVGVVGHNGSGKSTLLKCVAGILVPTHGTARVGGRAAALLELGAGFHPELTGRDNVYLNGSLLGLSRREIDERFDDIIAFSEVGHAIDQQVKHFSSGMYVRLGFAIAAHSNPDVLLVDEVLAVGDPAFQRRCIDHVEQFRREGGAVLFVSHDTNLVHRVCDRVAVLHHGRLVAEGEPGGALETLRRLLFEGTHATTSSGGESDSKPRILEVRMSTDGGGVEAPASLAALRPGARLVIDVEVLVPSAFRDVTVGIEVRNAEGALVFGTNTDLVGASLGAILDARQTVDDKSVVARFDLRALALTAGTYSLVIGAHSADSSVYYDLREPAGWFSVVDDVCHAGVANLDPKVTVHLL